MVSYFSALRDQIRGAWLLLANQVYGLLNVDVDFCVPRSVFESPSSKPALPDMEVTVLIQSVRSVMRVVYTFHRRYTTDRMKDPEPLAQPDPCLLFRLRHPSGNPLCCHLKGWRASSPVAWLR